MGFFDFLKKSSAPATPVEPTFPLTLAADAKGTVKNPMVISPS